MANDIESWMNANPYSLRSQARRDRMAMQRGMQTIQQVQPIGLGPAPTGQMATDIRGIYNELKTQQQGQMRGTDGPMLKSGRMTDGPLVKAPTSQMGERVDPLEMAGATYGQTTPAQTPEQMYAAKAAAGTLTIQDVLAARQSGNNALADSISQSILGKGWNYTAPARGTIATPKGGAMVPRHQTGTPAYAADKKGPPSDLGYAKTSAPMSGSQSIARAAATGNPQATSAAVLGAAQNPPAASSMEKYGPGGANLARRRR